MAAPDNGRQVRVPAAGESRAKTITGVIGNVQEWYDFALYGYMAPIISGMFFPSHSELASLLATYGVFAAGFVMRPLGGVLFGWIGDQIGRARALALSMLLISLPTVLLGLLPEYAAIGVAAPVLLTLIRLVQGLSVGGEFSSSVTYLVETAPRTHRGTAGSWANIGSILGMLLGSALAAATTTFLDTQALHEWGWRLPFLFGGVLGIAAIYLRRNLHTSPHFQQHQAKRGDTAPLKEAFTRDLRITVQAILFASAYGVMFYIPLVYLPTWMHDEAGLALDTAQQINTAGTALLLPLIPLMAWISDRWIRRSHFIALAMVVMAVGSWPLYALAGTGHVLAYIAAQAAFSTLVAVPLGVAPALMVELFPSEDRLTGYSLAYNLGLGVVGGTAPMISTWLIEVTGTALSPAVYLGALALMAAIVLMTMRDRSREALQ